MTGGPFGVGSEWAPDLSGGDRARRLTAGPADVDRIAATIREDPARLDSYGFGALSYLVEQLAAYARPAVAGANATAATAGLLTRAMSVVAAVERVRAERQQAEDPS